MRKRGTWFKPPWAGRGARRPGSRYKGKARKRRGGLGGFPGVVSRGLALPPGAGPCYGQAMPSPARSRRRAPSGLAVPPAQAVPVAALLPNPANPRRHPERQLNTLVAALERFGQVRPIVARAADNVVIAGHGVLEASKRLGRTHVDAILVDWDQRTADAYMLADNRIPELARDDADAVAALLDQIDRYELDAIGFTEQEAKVYLAMAEPAEGQIFEIDIEDVHDQFWVSLHGPLAKQAVVLQALDALTKEHADVELRIGTVKVG